MYQAVYTGKLSGNGYFTKKCQQFFEDRYGFKKCLLTTSGTDALEMCAMLCDLKPGDEVIVPSYTFVSTALAFLREGATVVFADSMDSNPNLDAEKLESLITPKTKVIAPVHYAGVACDMDVIMSVAEKHNLIVVEDAAQAIDSFYMPHPQSPLLKARGDVNSADIANYGLLEENAKRMRQNPTEAEKVLWEYLRGNQMNVKFRRQHVIDNFILDFVSLEKRLVIEADGGYHNVPEQKEYDDARENWLKENGFTVLRFTNEHILMDIDNTISIIKSHISSLPSLPFRSKNPSPSGEGLGVRLPLGGIGHLGAFSFHETKNITAGGEGGLLTINDERFIRRSEILWEKGTNRAEFFRGAVNKYGWVDMGSSFLPAEINAAFLWAQLENLDDIQSKRKALWERYYEGLHELAMGGAIKLPVISDYATNNGHMFYIVCRNLEERTGLIKFLKEHDILAPFHYLSLHKSEYYLNNCELRPELPMTDMYTDCLVRMPMFYELTMEQVDYIVGCIKGYFETRS